MKELYRILNTLPARCQTTTVIRLGICLIVISLSTCQVTAFAASRDPYLDDYHDAKYDPDPNDLLTNVEPVNKPSCHVKIEISVQHNDKPKESFTCYPYPVKPPEHLTKQTFLPTSRAAIRGYLLTSGYAIRSENMYPYPMFGWRWQYAYHAALRNYPGTVPHGVASLYPWIDDMSPLVLKECKRINDKEKLRQTRWQKATDDYNANHEQLEEEASRKGLAPVTMTMNKRYLANVDLPPGTWWISGMHKVPGLTFYWQEPITLSVGDNQTILLNEDNALVIEGGW